MVVLAHLWSRATFKSEHQVISEMFADMNGQRHARQCKESRMLHARRLFPHPRPSMQIFSAVSSISYAPGIKLSSNGDSLPFNSPCTDYLVCLFY